MEQLAHIGFGLIMTDGKNVTRDGTLIELKELVSKAKEKVAEISTEKGNELSDDDVQIIAIGAIIYNDLSRSRTKNIEFNWTTMLSMESGSSVYLQYTYARVGSICRKLKDQYDGMSDTVAMDDIELMVVKWPCTNYYGLCQPLNMPANKHAQCHSNVFGWLGPSDEYLLCQISH